MSISYELDTTKFYDDIFKFCTECGTFEDEDISKIFCDNCDDKLEFVDVAGSGVLKQWLESVSLPPTLKRSVAIPDHPYANKDEDKSMGECVGECVGECEMDESEMYEYEMGEMDEMYEMYEANMDNVMQETNEKCADAESISADVMDDASFFFDDDCSSVFDGDYEWEWEQDSVS